jgi:hypothetical protein
MSCSILTTRGDSLHRRIAMFRFFIIYFFLSFFWAFFDFSEEHSVLAFTFSFGKFCPAWQKSLEILRANHGSRGYRGSG